MNLCNMGEVYIFEDGFYISRLENPRSLKLSINVLPALINTNLNIVKLR